jgi:hypothetical protein
MTSADLRDALALLGLSERGLARATGYSAGAVRMWTTGRARTPEPVASWLQRRVKEWRSDPPPDRRAA